MQASRLAWKPDWPQAQRAFTGWWARKGLAVSVSAPRDPPWETLPDPGEARTPEERWLDLEHRLRHSQWYHARRFHGGTAFPVVDGDVGGPGSLGLFLGAVGHPAMSTVWYGDVIHDVEAHPPLRLDRTGEWWLRHEQILRRATDEARGRYLVGYPDLIENIDTLAQLRNPQDLLCDLIERPDWVHRQLDAICDAYFECYDAWWPLLRDETGGSAFRAFGIWGPGRTAKVQCDFSCMIGAGMFREFVVPTLRRQCEWLDCSLYHLDGTQALHHLEALLEIEALDAIEWTPQSGLPGGGSPQWYDLYRRIKAGGKGVQAIGVRSEEVEPLIEAVGPEGLLVMTWARTEAEARALLRRVGWQGEV